jgi:hypothetical protein
MPQEKQLIFEMDGFTISSMDFTVDSAAPLVVAASPFVCFSGDLVVILVSLAVGS